ncbi:MAG: hypothetical protein KDE08_01340 [Rhodobacteraceae bacterium]|nr:hypothetical protein [Paracoccaceae bacterium]
MTLDPAIVPLLSDIAGLGNGAGTGRRPIAGSSTAERLQAIVELIAGTVLPRSYVIHAGEAAVGTLTVASGRLMKIALAASDASAKPDSDTREAQISYVAQALALVAGKAGDLLLETNYLADDLAAEDVGQTATELRDFFGATNWLADGPAGEDGDYLTAAAALAVAQVAFDAEGQPVQRTGDAKAAPGDGDIHALAAELSSWQSELEELAGLPALLVVRDGPSGRAMALTVGADPAVLSILEGNAVPQVKSLWDRSQGDGAPS